jgi:predicted ATP-binding protein involved in virulence
MYIKRIILNNIRGFEELDFDLTRSDGSYAGWTVFTGDNGSGKSALLKAIAVGLVKQETAFALQPNFHRWIREGENEALIKLNIMEIVEEDFFSTYNKYEDFERQLNIKLKRNGREIKFLNDAEPPYTQDTQKSFSGSYSWFICGYGPFRRIFGTSLDASRRSVAPQTDMFATLFDESASLAEVDQWLKNLHHKSLEENQAACKHLQLLLDLLRDELLPNEITVDRVDSDGLWLKDRNGIKLAWSDMSDGYRSALALLADILRHLIEEENFWRLLSGIRLSDEKQIVNRHGVVLIDEIDAHLHPEWQQKIGFWLKRHFPNIQFLVTTHSPIICQAADDNGLFVLPEPGSHDQPKALSKEEYNKVIASRPDTILLTSAFGLQNTRSPRAVEARAAYAKLQAKRRAGAQLTPGEEAQLSQLEVFGENEEEL